MTSHGCCVVLMGVIYRALYVCMCAAGDRRICCQRDQSGDRGFRGGGQGAFGTNKFVVINYVGGRHNSHLAQFSQKQFNPTLSNIKG